MMKVKVGEALRNIVTSSAMCIDRLKMLRKNICQILSLKLDMLLSITRLVI